MLFTFPSRYSSLSVSRYVSPWEMVLPDSHPISRAGCYLGSVQLANSISPTGLSPSLAWLPSQFGYLVFRSGYLTVLPAQPRYHAYASPVCFLTYAFWAFNAFAHRYSRHRFCFLFLRLLRCFTSPGSLPFRDGRNRLRSGCPIRVSTSLRLFAP